MNEIDTYKARMKRLREFMKVEKLDLVISYADVWRCGNVQYFTGWWVSGGGISQASSFLIVTPEEDPILAVGFEQVENVKILVDFVQAESSENLEKILKSLKTSTNRVGLTGKNIIPLSYIELISSALSNPEIIDLTEIIDDWRRIKADWEIERLRQASYISDLGIMAAVAALKDGISELEIMAVALKAISEKGAIPSFYPTVCIGKKSAIPMRYPGNDVLHTPGIVLLDVGARYNGYAGDITRAVGYGKISAKEEEILHVAELANQAGKAIIKPGIRSSDVNKAVQKATIDAGMGDFLVHDSSHGIGIDHEESFPLGVGKDIELQENMVFTVESGVYVPGVGGARIEDVVVVTKTGCEVLNNVERGIRK